LQHGKIFTGRLAVTLMTHILVKRRHGRKICNRICLNHFVTDNFSISIKDIFSSHEYAFLVPVFNETAFVEFQKNNEWIRKYKINLEFNANNLKLVPNSSLSIFAQKLTEKFLQNDSIEHFLRKWQKKRIERNPKTRQMGGVILTDDSELAFWPNFENQGPKVFDKFQEKLAELKRSV